MNIPEQRQVSEEPRLLQDDDTIANTDIPEKSEDTGFLLNDSLWNEVIDSQNPFLLGC